MQAAHEYLVVSILAQIDFHLGVLLFVSAVTTTGVDVGAIAIGGGVTSRLRSG